MASSSVMPSKKILRDGREERATTKSPTIQVSPVSWRRLNDALRNLCDAIDRQYIFFSIVLLTINLIGCIGVIHFIPYTEIDWETYMIQVSSVMCRTGERNYTNIEGPTGPLVYPAAHVWIYSILYKITSEGSNIRLAQYIFAGLHTTALAFVLRLYYHTHRLPLFLTPLLFLSRRVLSLFVLRLFNDALQTVPLYAALLLFVQNRWRWGCVLYSIAVAIKMNALLYAPGLAILLCQAVGLLPAVTLAFCLFIPVQLLLGAPFLAHAPVAYLVRAFEFSRKFLYKWSVNGACLPQYIFSHPYLSIGLLAAHLVTLLVLAHTRWTDPATNGLVGLISPSAWRLRSARRLRPTHILFVLFSSNFVGILFARTLHYQFYVWYAHSLLFLLWKGPFPTLAKLVVVLSLEVVFNIYPPHAAAAVVLHVAHFMVLMSLLADSRAAYSTIYVDVDIPKRRKRQ